MKERFDVTGMTCSACSSHVEKSVGKLTGAGKCQRESADKQYAGRI